MVFGMVAGGGHARTIGAGFAIQVWQPVTGFIPPRTPAAWSQLFALYQHTAQYQAATPHSPWRSSSRCSGRCSWTVPGAG